MTIEMQSAVTDAIDYLRRVIKGQEPPDPIRLQAAMAILEASRGK